MLLNEIKKILKIISLKKKVIKKLNIIKNNIIKNWNIDLKK